MRHGMAVIAGVVAGAIGAALWAAISYFANAEVGYIAWGIGFLTGYAVARFVEDDANAFTGVIAASCAVVAVLVGKYAAAHLGTHDALQRMNAQPPQINAEMMINSYAHDIAEERAAKGQPVRFAGNKKQEDVRKLADFPADVQQAAKERWEKMPAGEQTAAIEQRTEEVQQLFQNLRGAIAQQAFRESFGIFDLLWFFLAVGTAFRLGSGGGDE